MRSYFRTTGVPSRMRRRMAVGAEYQTVILCFWMKAYQLSDEKPASSTACVTPLTQGPMMPYDVPVTQPGSAVHQ